MICRVSDELWSRRRTAFGTAADSYADGRPRYPREVLEWALPSGACEVLDLGAGTGIVTAGLLELGVSVISVEPLEAMRALIPAAAHTVAGSAEDIPVTDTAVDAVLCGQAWHWFDRDRAIPEVHRVLRPGGTLTLMWNVMHTDDPFTRALADILNAEERSDEMTDEDEQPPFDDPDRFAPFERRLVPHVQTYDEERLVRFTLSRSQTIVMEPADRERLLGQVRATAGDGGDLHLLCEAWRAVRR